MKTPRLKTLNGFPNIIICENVLPASKVFGSRNDGRYVFGCTIERDAMGSFLFSINYDKVENMRFELKIIGRFSL